MVVRLYCKCAICNKVTMIKYQMGDQSFPVTYTCPNCLTEIRGQCNNRTDRLIPDFTFENASELKEHTTPDFFMQASRELPTAHIKNYENEDQFALSPYMCLGHELNSLPKVSNWNRAISFTNNAESTIHRIFDLIRLWENGKTDVLALQLKANLPAALFPLNNRAEIYRALRTEFIHFVNPLLPHNWKAGKITFKKILDVHQANQPALEKYIDIFEKNYEMGRLERKLNSAIESFMGLVPLILPAYLAFDITEIYENTDKYALSTVSFKSLLDFYQKSYETILDAGSIFIALNNILYRNDFENMPHSQNKTFSDSVKEPNKFLFIKDNLVQEECFSELIISLPRNRIRNSIGHFSTEFDGVTQVIRFIDTHKGETREECISLLQFAVLCIENFHTCFYLSEIIYHLRKWYCIMCGDIPFLPNTDITSELNTTSTRFHKKVGRNDPCPCGSGIKYKKCCGKPGTF